MDRINEERRLRSLLDRCPVELNPEAHEEYFDAFTCGDYASLVLLGYSYLAQECPAQAYAAWCLALLKEVPDVVPLLVELSDTMSIGELLAAEEDVKELLPMIAKHHCH